MTSDEESIRRHHKFFKHTTFPACASKKGDMINIMSPFLILFVMLFATRLAV